MIYDTWSATKKPIHNQWGVSSDEQIWMNSHRNCFPEKNSEGIKFDPSPENYNFPHMWMNYGNLEAFSKYKLGQIDEPRKMFGIGGCDERYIDGWISALNNPKTFAESLLDLAEHYNITGGVDLDWEPLSEVFGVLNNNFGSVAPLVNLVNTIKIEAANRGILDYKITFTASVDQQYIWDFDTLMPQKKGAWAELSRYVDQIEIAGYDMHGPFDQNKMTGLHSALFPVYKDKSGLSDAGAIQLLHELGVPYSKMILGIPSYARSVSGVTKPGLNQPFQEAYRGDVDIEDSWEEPIGVTSYKWITENIPALNIKIINDSSWPNAFCDLDQQDIPSQIGSYAYLDGVFHSFDTTKTAAAKAIYSKNIGLGGNMIWSVETDAPSPHSLARAIYDAWEIV